MGSIAAPGKCSGDGEPFAARPTSTRLGRRGIRRAAVCSEHRRLCTNPTPLPAASPAAPAPPLSDFVLGDWLVEPGLNRLSRHGTALHVRPQLMDVLVCLAGASGRTVHRDELLRRVWPGQSTVADSAIARCIAELRQALGDQAAAPDAHRDHPQARLPRHRAGRRPRPTHGARNRTRGRRAPRPPRPRTARRRLGRAGCDRARLLARQFAGAFSTR